MWRSMAYAMMFGLVAWLLAEFAVSGFWAALFGSLVVSITSTPSSVNSPRTSRPAACAASSAEAKTRASSRGCASSICCAES